MGIKEDLLKELREGIEIARGKVEEETEKTAGEIENSLNDLNQKAAQRLEGELYKLSQDPEVAAKMEAAQAQAENSEVMGDIAAAEENIRLAQESAEAKINSALLQAQMTVNELKAKKAELEKQEDKESRARYINNLISYAKDCEELAENFRIEADLAYKEAEDEKASYAKDFGETL